MPVTPPATPADHDEAALENCRRLLQQCQTLVLSTLNEQGQPAASYAPFVLDENQCFYIFISELAAHTRQLLSHPVCAVLVIRDERESSNPFARERFSVDCRAEQVAPDDPQWALQLEALEQRFGDTVGLLKSLPDFRLLRLVPERGRYVMGFGKAYEVNAQWLFQPIGPPVQR